MKLLTIVLIGIGLIVVVFTLMTDKAKGAIQTILPSLDIPVSESLPEKNIVYSYPDINFGTLWGVQTKTGEKHKGYYTKQEAEWQALTQWN